MRISALEQLAEEGTIFIQKKGDEWLVECVRRDEYGFLVGRISIITCLSVEGDRAMIMAPLARPVCPLYVGLRSSRGLSGSREAGELLKQLA